MKMFIFRIKTKGAHLKNAVYESKYNLSKRVNKISQSSYQKEQIMFIKKNK
jgi:hypothetical protein